jgi:hypothetical protein
MTREEAVQLCALIQEACPSQQMGEFTPDLWREFIPESYTLAECRAAAVAIVRRGERYVDIGQVIAEVRRVRGDAAERERTAILLDAERYRTEYVEAADAAFLAKLAARTGGAAPKAVPPPDYEGER